MYTAAAKPGDNLFIVEARDASGKRGKYSLAFSTKSGSANEVQAKAPVSVESLKRVSLWVLTVGVSKYQDPSMNLEYADNDALVLAETLKGKAASLFGEVHVKSLVNDQVTRESVMDAIEKHLGQASPDDVVFLFMAGHGVQHDQTKTYYYLTHDTTFDNMTQRGLRMSDLDEQVKILTSNVHKVIVLTDTCQAGAMKLASIRSVQTGKELNEAISALNKAEGTISIGASTAGEKSYENASWNMHDKDPGHGAFTYALLKGLSGEASHGNETYLSVQELLSYVSRQVPRLTEGKQHPKQNSNATDIPLMLLK